MDKLAEYLDRENDELRYVTDWLKQFFYDVYEAVEDEDCVYAIAEEQVEAIKEMCEYVSEMLNL